MNNTIIFIIEDDKYMNETLKEVLESEGYKVETSLSAIDAVNKIVHFNKKYNLLILDYNLQHMNDISGIDIYELAKKMNPRIQAIMISAYNDKSIKEKALSKGIRKFMEKPFLINDFIENVNLIANEFSRENNGINGYPSI